jgi:hypothetical protein
VVGTTGAGEAFVSEMLAAGRDTIEPPEIDGDTMDAASIRSLRNTLQNTNPMGI